VLLESEVDEALEAELALLAALVSLLALPVTDKPNCVRVCSSAFNNALPLVLLVLEVPLRLSVPLDTLEVLDNDCEIDCRPLRMLLDDTGLIDI